MHFDISGGGKHGQLDYYYYCGTWLLRFKWYFSTRV